MQRGSDVWAWTGFDTAFERGKVDRIEAHKGVIHVKLDKGGKMFECKDDTVHLANHQNQDGVADNTELRQLNEATLLHNIRSRYTKDEAGCYTVTGHILIAVNPFKQLTIYDEKQVRSFPGPICVRAPPSTSRARPPPRVFLEELLPAPYPPLLPPPLPGIWGLQVQGGLRDRQALLVG